MKKVTRDPSADEPPKAQDPPAGDSKPRGVAQPATRTGTLKDCSTEATSTTSTVQSLCYMYYFGNRDLDDAIARTSRRFKELAARSAARVQSIRQSEREEVGHYESPQEHRPRDKSDFSPSGGAENIFCPTHPLRVKFEKSVKCEPDYSDPIANLSKRMDDFELLNKILNTMVDQAEEHRRQRKERDEHGG